MQPAASQADFPRFASGFDTPLKAFAIRTGSEAIAMAVLTQAQPAAFQ